MATLFSEADILSTGGGALTIGISAVFQQAYLLLVLGGLDLAHKNEYAAMQDYCRYIAISPPI